MFHPKQERRRQQLPGPVDRGGGGRVQARKLLLRRLVGHGDGDGRGGRLQAAAAAEGEQRAEAEGRGQAGHDLRRHRHRVPAHQLSEVRT